MTKTIAARHGTALHVSGNQSHTQTNKHTHMHTHVCRRNGEANMAKLHKYFYSMVSIKLWARSTDSRSDSLIHFKLMK